VKAARPNAAHHALVALEDRYAVQVITQNIDDLHERAGSRNVIHLHGEINKARSTRFPELVYELNGKDLAVGDRCERGFQLRPHIVWFGELVPMLEIAAEHLAACDILVVVGTSLEVYPAAGLVHYAGEETVKYLVDPAVRNAPALPNLEILARPAGKGVPELVNRLLAT
jgi:NAD-dependent deacetylase